MNNEISNTQKMRDVECITIAAEQTVANFAAVMQLSKRYNYPALAEVITATDELISQFFLVSNYIQNPQAETIIKSIRDEQTKLECKINSLG